MKDFKIVEYQHSYAKSLAEMWLRSTDAWGGASSAITEDSIKQDQDNSSFLNTYLAVVGDEAIGLCYFSEYRDDTGALYIPGLNVRPDFHGKGVGKALILKAVERTIELNWPRLDLYTWPGNTKAVPLYKKCGFFWEKRDDKTHLMNFIPTVMTTEAVKDYFKNVDWYKDSKRVIQVEPDGIEENGFEYFEYLWEKNGNSLRMQFEKSGRGLRLIETNEYLIRASIENYSLVFGKSYKVKYEIINKTGDPLKVSIKGHDNENIRFSLNEIREITNKETIEGDFYLGVIDKEQDDKKNHPTVNAEIMINGKKAVFKVGVLPKFPGKISLQVPERQCLLGKEEELYIDIKNNFDEEANFEFMLPSNENITFNKNRFNINLKAKERKSIPIKCVVNEFNLYSAKVTIAANLINEGNIEFKREIGALFKGYRGILWGETEKGWYIVNGSCTVEINKSDNSVSINNSIREEFGTTIMYPQIGKPYSDELSKKEPRQVEYFKENDAVVIRLTYRSDSFEGIDLISIVKLYANGIMEHYNEIQNYSNSNYNNELWINQRIRDDLYDIVMPYDGKYVETKNFSLSFHEDWEGKKITENWIFSRGFKVSRGLCWSKDYDMNFLYWYGFLSINMGGLLAKETKRTESLYLAIGTFENWRDFRDFALKNHAGNSTISSNALDIRINDGNPFVKDNFVLEIKEHRNIHLNGRIDIEGMNNGIERKTLDFNAEDKVNFLKANIDRSSNFKEFEIVKVNIDLYIEEYIEEKGLFGLNNCVIEKDIAKENDVKVYKVDNGIMSIKASPEFSNSIFSLVCNNKEWLDNSFPTLKPKSWYNPWSGGISIYPEHLSMFSISEEKITVEFIEKIDNLGNSWNGIKTTLYVEKNEIYKGLEINQYYLMLPGVPVLCYTSEILQNTKRFIDNEKFYNIAFLKPDDDIKNAWVNIRNKKGKERKYKCGRVETSSRAHSTITYGSNKRKEVLHIYGDVDTNEITADLNNEITTNTVVNFITAKDGERTFTAPVFYILSEKNISHDQLKDLKNIAFDNI